MWSQAGPGPTAAVVTVRCETGTESQTAFRSGSFGNEVAIGSFFHAGTLPSDHAAAKYLSTWVLYLTFGYAVDGLMG